MFPIGSLGPLSQRMQAQEEVNPGHVRTSQAQGTNNTAANAPGLEMVKMVSVPGGKPRSSQRQGGPRASQLLAEKEAAELARKLDEEGEARGTIKVDGGVYLKTKKYKAWKDEGVRYVPLTPYFGAGFCGFLLFGAVLLVSSYGIALSVFGSQDQCRDHGDCVRKKEPYCAANATRNICTSKYPFRSCTTDVECAYPKDICYQNKCVECSSNTHCREPIGICKKDPKTYDRCVQCAYDTDCPRSGMDPSYQYCDICKTDEKKPTYKCQAKQCTPQPAPAKPLTTAEVAELASEGDLKDESDEDPIRAPDGIEPRYPSIF